MPKKSGKKDNTNKRKSSEKCKNNSSKNNKSFSSFTYADLIVLSATLSYSIAEELDEDDLAILVVFLGLLLSEIELIIAQRALEKNSSDNTILEEDVDDT